MIRGANAEVGGSVIEIAEAEDIVRATALTLVVIPAVFYL